MSTRRPTHTYEGWNHETLGSELIAAFSAVDAIEPGFSAHWMPFVRKLEADRWYSIDLLLALGMAAEARFGAEVLRAIGRRIFEVSHAEQFRQVARSVADVVYGIDGMYRAVNRGDTIGGWTVLGFDATHARLEKSTPHQCHIEEGILISACNALGVDVEVRQERCVRDGGESCVMVVTPASATDRWTADSPAAGAPAEPAAEESAPGVRRTG